MIAPQEGSEEMEVEDEAADTAGQFGLGLVFLRVRRGLDRIEGWPGKLRGILKSERHEKDILKWFGLDIEIFKELKATPEVTDPNGELYMQYRRHPMHLTAVKQWQYGYEEGESALPSLRELAERRCVAFYGSVLEEEKFKVQKNDDQPKGHKQFRAPETAFVKVLQKEIVNERRN